MTNTFRRQLQSQSTGKAFRSKPWYPCLCGGRWLYAVEPFLKLLGPPIGISVELYFDSHSGFRCHPAYSLALAAAAAPFWSVVTFSCGTHCLVLFRAGHCTVGTPAALQGSMCTTTSMLPPIQLSLFQVSIIRFGICCLLSVFPSCTRQWHIPLFLDLLWVVCRPCGLCWTVLESSARR